MKSSCTFVSKHFVRWLAAQSIRELIWNKYVATISIVANPEFSYSNHKKVYLEISIQFTPINSKSHNWYVICQFHGKPLIKMKFSCACDSLNLKQFKKKKKLRNITFIIFSFITFDLICFLTKIKKFENFIAISFFLSFRVSFIIFSLDAYSLRSMFDLYNLNP